MQRNWRWQAPPGWPEPPPGWAPYPGWAPQPGWPPAPTGWQFWVPADHPRPPASPLDQAVADSRAGPSGWGRASAICVLGTLGLIVLGSVLSAVVHFGQLGGAIASLVAELLLAAITVAAVRPLVAEQGGWRAALGWSRPTFGDAGRGIGWFVVQKICQAVLLIVLIALIPHLSARQYSNTIGLNHLSPLALALFGVAAVIVAPVVEETQFRGVLLRAGMRRFGFWRGALISSAVFGAFHTYEAGTLTGAAVLGLAMFLFGLLQCVLVRSTGRLFPAAVAHAANNALSVILLGI